ncbi:MAG TPA: hypothetical protein VNE82_24345 [Candidatus Binataceae bacterium]|nr:hypothetical protein [Candidatus Binataceae bacterium]
MKPFSFAPVDFAADFGEHGYAHIKQGVSKEFLLFAKDQLAKCRLSGQNELSANEIKNKKKQYLFELPENANFLGELTTAIGTVAGLPVAQMTLSERHIKVYEDCAFSMPRLHKDCVASQVAVGIPLEQGIEARLVLLTGTARRVNCLDSAIYGPRPIERAGGLARWYVEDGEDAEAGELGGDRALIELDVRPGDVVMFEGSSIYHERLYGAKSAVLYLKFNAMRLDHLTEDPSTVTQRQKGLELLEQRNDEQLLESIVEVSPRLRRVSRHYTRQNWTSVLQAYVSGEKEFAISDDDLHLLFALEGCRTVRDVLTGLGVIEDQLMSHVPRIRRLGKLGGIDLLR